jgi:hypothetical protein
MQAKRRIAASKLASEAYAFPYFMRARLILGMLGTSICAHAYAVHIIDPSKDSEEKYRWK